MNTRFASILIASSLLVPQFAEAGKPKTTSATDIKFDPATCIVTTTETVTTGKGKKAITEPAKIIDIHTDKVCSDAKTAQQKIDRDVREARENAERQAALVLQIENNKLEAQRLAAEAAAKQEKERLVILQEVEKAKLATDQVIALQRLETSSSILTLAFQKAVDPGQKTYLAAEIIKGLKSKDKASRDADIKLLEQGGFDVAGIRTKIMGFKNEMDLSKKIPLGKDIIEGIESNDEVTRQSYLEFLRECNVPVAEVRKLFPPCRFIGKDAAGALIMNCNALN